MQYINVGIFAPIVIQAFTQKCILLTMLFATCSRFFVINSLILNVLQLKGSPLM